MFCRLLLFIIVVFQCVCVSVSFSAQNALTVAAAAVINYTKSLTFDFFLLLRRLLLLQMPLLLFFLYRRVLNAYKRFTPFRTLMRHGFG